jgi:c-di-GMP-binding flagellar brake protein YcgR
MSEQDQRRHPRLPTQQSVWVEGQEQRAAKARNISRGGMFVVSEGAPPEIGSTLQIRFEDPHEGQVEVKMEVVWREENTATSKLGLRLLDSAGIAAFERVVVRHEADAEGRPTRDEEPSER